nr:hypothetical protein [Mesorhizobium sp. CA15]
MLQRADARPAPGAGEQQALGRQDLHRLARGPSAGAEAGADLFLAKQRRAGRKQPAEYLAAKTVGYVIVTDEVWLPAICPGPFESAAECYTCGIDRTD